MTTTVRKSTDVTETAVSDQAPASETLPRGYARVVFLHRGPAGNDAELVDRAPRDREVEPPMWRALPPDSLAAGDYLEMIAATKPGATEMHQTARAYRSYAFGEITVAVVTTMVDGILEMLARWQQYRQARQIRRALAELDDRTLHDLGLYRGEIGSVAAELSGHAERTRMLSTLARDGFLT
jgi:uncharacterized protein YjiS (DUF1127 family)